MFYAETTPKTVKLYFNDTLVLNHTQATPFLSVLTGDSKPVEGLLARAFSAAFSKYRPLTEARYDETRKLLRFSHGDISISFAVIESDGTLLLKPHKYSEDISKVRLCFPATPGEPVFGGGSVRETVNLRGKKFSLLAGERGPYGSSLKSDVLSGFLKKGEFTVSPFAIPLFVSSDFSSVFLEFGGHVLFDFTHSTYHAVEAAGVPQTIVFTSAGTPAAHFKQLRKLGRTSALAPPVWCSEGLIVGISGGAERMIETIDRYKRAGVAIAGLFVRDWCGVRGDANETEFWDWIWNRDLYPHLDEVMRQLTSRGIRTLGYLNSHFCIEGRLFAEASKEGYLIKNRDGSNYLSDMGGFMAGHLDLTHPEACAWFRRIVMDNVIGLGFSGFFADRGGLLPDNCVLHSGESPVELRNLWPAMWSKLNHDAARACKSRDLFLFTSSGGASAPTMSAFADGSGADWSRGHGLSSVLNEILSLGFSGVGVSHCDAGMHAPSIPDRCLSEQLIRWAEFSAFTPVMLGHSLRRALLDSIRLDDVLFHLARMSKLHKMLAPYIGDCLRSFTLTGMPVLRHMWMMDPTSRSLASSSSQFMVGDELIVAPVTRAETQTASVFLPEGEWLHLLSGQAFASGEQQVEAPLGSPAAFYKKDGKYERILSSVAYNLI